MAFKTIGLANKAANKSGGGIVIDLGWGADLFNLAQVEDSDPVGQVQGLFLIMGDKYGRHARGIMDSAQFLTQRLAHRGIERPKRLVQQQDLWRDRKRPGQGDALALAA